MVSFADKRLGIKTAYPARQRHERFNRTEHQSRCCNFARGILTAAPFASATANASIDIPSATKSKA
ncbi:hypothetical protein M703_03525 [Neisseria gonorrhoeae SK29344]|uniref:Uncharacterized protein n=2 Tax=Neisseria gonorrhoeae TaxID=485 RepID=A0AA44ZHU3_NEIGO|nr:Hypothetical protein NGK_2510 [Neisseria gonorrhoeae NCCP11945]KLR78148.1 hypothetical protein M717_01850 [Neisseria gonorrhoeae SK33414]KLR81493.1 hypothetical protein M679_01050 [Neisseria gonorrhoeae SK7842]KLR89753.1 hypothetical protein M677_08160 [Neisseria gonorrhoeae SK6987]KLR93454.1 hypothetical protein M678_10240 [Neisseria gonorrhoeae SK7461]KLS07103.1 hypothetical protein M703_03525 [Neisseria gonorrhoeae SK29344]KLS13938.1 hypothetical protein M726_11165 [Neisseria gonorrhoea